MRHGRVWSGVSLSLLIGVAAWVAAQPPKTPPAAEEPDEPNAEEAREKAIADRFRKVLETNPRRGTALDKLYGYHVERGSLDALVKEYADKAAKDDGIAAMIVGLLEAQRGKDAAAVAAFKQAEAKLPDNAVASYYLGQSLVLVGQPEAAAEAFERAITRKPNRNDLLDVFQALGRVYQRAQRTEKALDVWNRLEKLYPDDARVQDQIASTLVEEGQYEQALPRVEKLAAATDDKYRQSALRMDAADLKVKLKRQADALADFEKLLGELNPDSWLYRDVRRRIEEVFLRNDDLAGLAKYYEAWLSKNATDVDAIARLAKNLSSQGRVPEAKTWLTKGLEVAPANRGLRQALIDQLAFEQNFAEAAKQFEAMDKAAPNDPDILREWGKMLMRDTAKPEADRRAAAAVVWRKILDKKPNDPLVASQVADLLRSANAVDDAIALYKKAIELAPNAPQYREYLGEFFHSQKRSDEALATWRPIAEGANRNSKNLARLAEVFAGFGYRKEAIQAMSDAIALERDDFTMLMTLAQLLHEDEQNDAALKQIDLASKLTSNPEEVEQVLVAQIKVFQAQEKLADKIDDLQKELDAGTDATAERYLRLARFFEANRQADKATEAINKAAAKDAKSVPVLIAAARIYEAGGNLLAAADANRKLAALDRRFRSEYLTQVAKLEQRLGRREQALQAGRDLLAASPGNPEVYKYYSDLCFQLGEQEEGLEALRRSVRANPSDPLGLITLANALAERVRQGEAIELLWRAFEKTNDLDGKLGVVERLTQLYLEANQFDKLVERLERERREAEKNREMTMCVAQAYTTAGDLGTARAQLERLLTENTRDTNLLSQLSSLCDTEGDLTASVKYQRLLVAAAPNNFDHQLRLASLLTRSGEAEEAATIWVKLIEGQSEAHKNLQSIDSLIGSGKTESALAILSRMLSAKPGNWELLYREGVALANRGKPDDAAVRFKAILATKLLDDEPGEWMKHQAKQAKVKAKAAPKPGQPSPAAVMRMAAAADEATNPPLTRRTGNLYQIRQATGMEAERAYYGGSQGPQAPYMPGDFGEARMACLGWLYELSRGKGEGDGFIKTLRTAKDKAGADTRPVWDWFYFQTLRYENKDLFATGLQLSKASADPAAALAFLNAAGSRPAPGGPSRSRGGMNDGKDKVPPLPADQLTHLLDCYAKLRAARPEWAARSTGTVLTELKRAKREDDEKKLYAEMVKEAVTVEKVQAAMQLAQSRDDMDTAVALYAKLEQIQGKPKTSAAIPTLPSRRATENLEHIMAQRVDAKKFDDALKLLDLGLGAARKMNISTPRAVSSARRPNTNGLSGYIPGKQRQQRYQVSYPSPNEYYDLYTLHILYTAFHKYREADLSSDLVAHFKKQADAAQGGPDQLYLKLALGYLHWWAEEKDESLAQLTTAAALAPNDHNLVMEVANLREQNNEPADALALLDGITPLDYQVMQRREEAALRLAEKTGNVDRAKQAAERLFGLRLDPDKLLELAGKMHRLGLHAQADNVLARAQRQAGNKTAVLARLMTQYQSQNQTDMAVQIARQLLRKGPSMTFNPYGGSNDDGTRNQAIGVLARSGQLKEIIERAEAQLKASPKSLQIHQTLLGFYQAAGDKEKQKATVKTMAQIKPDDGKLRWQTAQTLSNLGDTDGAIAEYKVAIKLEPSFFANRYWEIQRLFTQANKFEELASVIDAVDLRKLQYYWSVAEIITPMLENEKTKEAGLKLFKKAWEAFPTYRASLLGQLYNADIWRLPEIYDYAKQAVIPRTDSEVDAWQAAIETMGTEQEGRVNGVLTRMLSVARKQQRLPELRAEAEAALKERPDWLAGKALIAVIDIQTGNKERGIKAWQELFADPKLDVPPLARFVLTQELEFYSGVEEMAVKTLEGGIDDMMLDGNYDLNYSPARRLIWWYQQTGRAADAKALTLKFATAKQENPGYSGGYWEYRQVQQKLSAAQELQRTGEIVEAVKLYNLILADRDTLTAANNYYGGERFDQQVEQAMQSALKGLKPDKLPAALDGLLSARKPTGGATALDLVLVVESRELSKIAMNGMLAAALKSTDKQPEARAKAVAKLAELVKEYPTDLSVQTAAALAAFADGKPAPAVEALVRLVEATPLEALPASGKPNARLRDEARKQIGLWLVARECLKDEKLKPAGEKLAARAADAAKRLTETMWATAILREWGQFHLDKGDATAAAAKWNELLDLSLPKPAKKKDAAAPAPAPPPAPAASGSGTLPLPSKKPNKVPSSASGQKPLRTMRTVARGAVKARSPQVLVVKGTNALAPAPSGGALPVPTMEQFKQAYEVAALAADKKLAPLSFRAITDAVKAGPPLPPKNQNRGGRGYIQKTINGQQYLFEQTDGNEGLTPDQALVDIAGKWKAAGFPAADIYAALATAVFPPARPAEVFLYTETKMTGGMVYMMTSSGSWQQTTDVPSDGGFEDRGLAGVLAQAAVEAGKVDDLRKMAEARAATPLGELPAKLILFTLAMKANDDARAGAILKELGEKSTKDTSSATIDTVIAACKAALKRPALAAQADAQLQKTALQLATANNLDKARQTGETLVNHHIDAKNFPAAKRLIDLGVEMTKRFAAGDTYVHAQAGAMYLRAGFVEEALAQYGLYADATSVANADPARRGRRPEPTVDGFEKLVRLLTAMPADKRYASLKTWTLPTAGRKSVRYYVGFMPATVPPPLFGTAAQVPVNGPVSTLVLLAQAAKQAGKLDELVAAADKLAADKVENGLLFKVMVRLATGSGGAAEADVKAFGEAAIKRMTEKVEKQVGSRYYYEDQEERNLPVHASELLFAYYCAADAKLAGYGEAIFKPALDRAQATNNTPVMSHIRRGWDAVGAAKAGAPDALANALPPRWFPHDTDAFWFGQDGYLAAGWAGGESHLIFDTPLTGTFEFAVDALHGGWAEGHVGYGGVIAEPHPTDAAVTGSAYPIGRNGNDGVFRPAPGLRAGQFNRLSVRVAPGSVQYLVNGQVFYEDAGPPAVSPWLTLFSGTGRRPVFRNATLTGTPTVPAEVKLSDGDALDGWLATGSVPQRLRPKEKKDKNGQIMDRWNNPVQLDAKDAKYDWRSTNGEIVGRKLDRAKDGASVPSRLTYFRPLRPGETVKYEFFHKPGEAHADPTVGPVAALLDPAGVKLRYLTGGGDDWTGLVADNAVEQPAATKAKPPLKANDWNAVSLSATPTGVKLEVNGTLVYEGDLGGSAERSFGFYHLRDKTAARIRNVVLTGPWAKTVDAAAVALTTKAPTPAAAKARRYQIGERYFYMEAGDIVAKAKPLPAAERYALLAGWVLPTESRPTFQLAGATTPLDAANATAKATGSRALLGYRFDAPALELVAAAKEAGKLDELADAVSKAASPAADDVFAQAKLALLAAVRTAQGKDGEAVAHLTQLGDAIKKLPPETPGAARWPLAVAFFGTIDAAGTKAAAGQLIDAANAGFDAGMLADKQFEDRDWWHRLARHMRAIAKAPTPAAFVHWESNPSVTATSRAKGFAAPRWTVSPDGVVTHHPGHDEDYLAFRVPFRGDVEVTCELRVLGWSEAHVLFGGHRIDIDHDMKKFIVHTPSGSRRETTIKQIGDGKPRWYAYKLAVKDGVFTMSVDGQEVTKEKIGPNYDPWLMLHAFHMNTADVRNLKIGGKPQVLDKVDLLADEGLGTWRRTGGTWAKRGEEVHDPGAKPEEIDGQPEVRSYPESAAFYHRPLIEDGAVEYESYYDPDKAHVHPALDRLVFLLEPGGVKLHRLTDGAAGTGDPSPTNETDEPQYRKATAVPLKPKAWNRVRLEVKGDAVLVSVNGTPVYERPIEPTNQRLFGLFHYTDRTEARARNVVHTGAWAKTLPANEELFATKK